MKKIFASVMLFAAAAMAFVSCSKDNTTDVISGKTPFAGGKLLIKSGIVETRTTLNDHKLAWAEGDVYGIFFVAEDGTTILGHTASPEYVPGQSDYELDEVPAGTAYLYCYYPCDEDYLENINMPTDATKIEMSINRQHEFADFGFDASYHPMAAKAEIDGNTANVKFSPLVCLLEVNVYNTAASTETLLNIEATIGEEDAPCAGDGYIDYTGTTPVLNLPESRGAWYLTPALPEAGGVAPDTKEDGLKVYLPFAKNVYSSLTLTLKTDLDTYTYEFSDVDLTMGGRTLNVNLAGESELPEIAGFAGAKGIDPMGNEKGTAELEVIDESSEYYDPDLVETCAQYVLYVEGTNFVQFETFPEGIDDVWTDGEEVEYQAGILSFFPTKKYEFDVVFKIDYVNVAYIHVIYSDENGGSDKPEYPFALDESSIKKGAVVRRTTETDDWYVALQNNGEQWTLIYNGEDDLLSFLAFPEIVDELRVVPFGDTEPYDYFEVLTTTSTGAADVALLGNGAFEAGITSAEYYVFFYNELEEVAYRLYVQCNVDAEGGEPSGELFALTDTGDMWGQNEIELRPTTEEDSWYEPALDYEQWTLKVTGTSDIVVFSALPNTEGLMVVEDQEKEKGYFEIQEGQGAGWTVSLMGDAWYTEDSASYNVVFYDPVWEDAYARLHVEYSKKADTDVVFDGAIGKAGTGAEEGAATLTELAADDENYKFGFTAGPQYLLEVVDASFVYFETKPDDAKIETEMAGVEYGGGLLSMPATNGDFEVLFLDKTGAYIARMYVRYTNQNGGGIPTDSPFILDEGFIKQGAVIRRTTETDEWYSTGWADVEQWTLIYNNPSAAITFRALPSIEEEPTVRGDYNYFVIEDQGTSFMVDLLGDDAYNAGETSAEYDVVFYDPQWGDALYCLHVRYNVDAEGGDQPSGELFALTDGGDMPWADNKVELRRTTEEDSWYKPALDYDQWTLKVTGNSDTVVFSALPNLKGLLILEDQDNENGYFQVSKQGADYVVYLLGDAYDDNDPEQSVTYTVTFDDPQWGDVYARLHVEYSKK